MFSVPDFLDRAKRAAGVDSDYALAVKVLGHKNQAKVSNWRLEKNVPDDESVIQLCKLTGDDPEDVAVRLQSMRAANDDTAELWRRIADRVAKNSGAASISFLTVLAMLFAAAYPDAARAALPPGDSSMWVCVLC